MVAHRPGFLTLAALALTILAIAYDGTRLTREQRFNDALVTGIVDATRAPDQVHQQFMKAYEIQQNGEFKQAVRAYAAIDTRRQDRLQTPIKYNLANLYMREALELRESADEDLAMPLIELAKQNYREILRSDAADWDTKFNLELALILAPETDAADAMEERNPEHSPRALTKIRSREPLP